jgi:hypothetical protein|tara:strand:- start:267 stop:401 length:135 start_codon:yes stop_codon:yes gene_type:complete
MIVKIGNKYIIIKNYKLLMSLKYNKVNNNIIEKIKIYEYIKNVQ